MFMLCSNLKMIPVRMRMQKMKPLLMLISHSHAVQKAYLTKRFQLAQVRCFHIYFFLLVWKFVYINNIAVNSFLHIVGKRGKSLI